jgi:hypothetical protein
MDNSRNGWDAAGWRPGFLAILGVLGLTACGGGGGGGSDSGSTASTAASSSAASSQSSVNVTTDSGTVGTALASCDVPAAWAVPTTNNVVGTGTAASCTEASLRSAVTAGGHVTFSCGGGAVTIPVTSSVTVSKTTVIDGAGLVTLDGGGTSRILEVGNTQSLSVRNMTFTNGKAAATMDLGTGIGGAIAGHFRSKVEVINSTFIGNTAGRGGGAVGVNTGSTLVIVGSVFKNNTSWYGGAVYSLLSPLTVVNSTFTGNSTVTDGGLGDGGAIGTDGASEDPNDSIGGDVSICGSKITNSQGYGNGGGAYLWVYPPDRIIIDRTTVENNAAGSNGRGNGGLGGAMRVSNGEIIIRRSSFLSNTSGGNGGGLYLDCAPSCALTNSTFYKNTASAYGGAVFGDGHTDNNVTYASNSAGGHGGALFGSKYVLKNTVFVDNSAGNPWGQAMNCSSTGTGDHVVQWLTSSAGAGADKCIAAPLPVNPLLAAPADNGGPTQTMLPGSASGLLGIGSGCVVFDQRGVARDVTKCDIGAVELP